MKTDVDAQNGYGIVINAFRMWIYVKRKSLKREKTENILRQLNSSQNDNSSAFVNATRALALSRLGLEGYEEAMSLFEMALKQCQNKPNIYWMFVRAIMQGRLARSDKSTMYGSLTLDENLKKAFEKERELLEEIRDKDSNFAWPIAYLGQCLYHLGKKEEALICLDHAMCKDKGNTDIALISSRVHKWNDKSLPRREIFKRLPDKLFLKSEEILKRLPEESKTPEVFFQFGLIYKERAKELSKCPAEKLNCDKKEELKRLLRKAMEYVEKTMEKDACHNPAAIKMAELLAQDGQSCEARDLYLDLISSEDTLPLNEFFIRKSANMELNKLVFDKTEVLDNIFGMLDLCLKNFTTFDKNQVGTFVNTVKNDAEDFLKELEAMSKDEKNETNTLAKNYFAQVLRRLGNFEGSKQVLLSLLKQPQNNMAELIWNLGKCYCGLGELDLAENEAKTLAELPPERDFQADEVYADVYLARAKGIEIFKDQEENLRRAIKKGSIEACYLYLKNVESPQERLCSLDGHIAETIAEIKACLERSNTFHHKTDESPDDLTDSIERDIASILVYPAQTDKIHQKRYERLSDIHVGFLRFERCYLQLRFSSDSWNKVCQNAAEEVLRCAHELLDHVIFDFQKHFRKKPGNPPKTNFPVFMDWKKAEVNQEKAKTDIHKYLERSFPGHEISQEMVNFFIQVQPRYSRDNLWLGALHDFAGKTKHTGNDDGSDTHSMCEGNITYKKVKLVRESCYEVEKIAEKILRHLQSQTS